VLNRRPHVKALEPTESCINNEFYIKYFSSKHCLKTDVLLRTLPHRRHYKKYTFQKNGTPFSKAFEINPEEWQYAPMLERRIQDKFRLFLLERYEEIKEKNPRTSKRSFATRIGVSPGTLTELLNGKRSVTDKLVQKVSKKLDLSPMDLENIYQPENESEHNYRNLSMDHFSLISDGIHFAILSLMDIEDFRYDYEWISKKLKKSKREIKSVIDRLILLEIVQKSGNQLIKKEDSFHSPDEISSAAIRKSHRQTLSEAEQSLDEIEVLLRDFTSITFSMNTDSLPELKKAIRSFRKKVLKITDSSHKKNDVYKMAIQLFPLTEKNY